MTTTRHDIRSDQFGLPPGCTLDGDSLASTLLRTVMVSAMLGHERPEHTARDYCQNVTSPEARFVRDVLTLPTAEICDRWFGGTMNAMVAITEVMEPLFADDDSARATR